MYQTPKKAFRLSDSDLHAAPYKLEAVDFSNMGPLGPFDDPSAGRVPSPIKKLRPPPKPAPYKRPTVLAPVKTVDKPPKKQKRTMAEYNAQRKAASLAKKRAACAALG